MFHIEYPPYICSILTYNTICMLWVLYGYYKLISHIIFYFLFYILIFYFNIPGTGDTTDLPGVLLIVISVAL